MNPEEFKRKYEDTHTELTVLEKLEGSRGSLIKTSPGDKNITIRGKIPGKQLIESVEYEKRTEGLKHCLLDACSARVGDLMDIPMDKLVALTIKTLPQKVEGKIEHEFTFAEMAKIAYGAREKLEKVETIDVEAT